MVDTMVAAVSAGKSSAAIGVHFSLDSVPTVGTALPIDIALVPHQKFTSLRARFEPQGGLTMISGNAIAPLSDPVTEKPIEHQLALMPQQAGVFMITVNVETEGAEGMVSRIFSIPVIVDLTVPEAAAPATPAAADTPAQPAAN